MNNRYLFQKTRLPHALLLSDYSASKDLAKRVLCLADNEVACEICQSCRLFEAGSHPDFFEVTSEEQGKAVKIDQIRDLIQSLQKTPRQSRLKVAMIQPAESMNLAASNALLKTLEEPAGDTVILLVTQKPNFLPATIRSRCQKLFFKSSESFVKTAEFETWEVLLSQTLKKEMSIITAAEKSLKVSPANFIDWTMRIVYERIKSQLFNDNKILNKNLFSFWLQLLQWRQDISVGINFSVQLLLENLFLQWQNHCQSS